MSSSKRPRAWSIAARLAVWFTLATFGLVAAATASLYFELMATVDREDDRFLVDTIQIIRSLLRTQPDNVAALEQEVLFEGEAREHARVFIRVLDAEQRVLLESPGAAPLFDGLVLEPAPAEPGPGIDVDGPGGAPYRVMAAWAPVGAGGRERRQVQVGVDRLSDHELMRGYHGRLWIVLALSLLASAAVGYTIARRGMAPVAAIAETARRVGSSTLDARIPPVGLPGELASLAATFNEMLDRLEEAFTRLSSLAADLAHELRTPINNLRGEIEVALGKPRTEADYAQVLASALEEATRLSQMVDGLLFLARAENPQMQIVRSSVDVNQELAAVRDFYEPAAAEAGIRFELVDDSERLRAAFDRTLVQRALGNLIQNAIAHTPRGGTIRLVADHGGGAVRIAVSDTGSGIPPEHLPRVGDRFYRVDPSRRSVSGGLGLGLAIAGTIVKVHGGTMEISSQPGRGTTVVLVFPDIA